MDETQIEGMPLDALMNTHQIEQQLPLFDPAEIPEHPVVSDDH